ncbi:MAG: hypothetical protein FJ053_06260 [Cyanobacteria bacterium M_surface_10_m1_298]|nr:hypothetical protein [Cyanobacteria bacterium M_surface_10_m1_298]
MPQLLQKIRDKKANEKGFILPLVMIISLIIATGLMALAARSWLGLSGTIRQSQSRQAREIAEAGIARLIESLNSQYAYLLIKDRSQWGNSSFASSICPNSSQGIPATTGEVSTLGKYTLLEYDFQGSPFYGGKAKIKMKGERSKDSKILATSIVDQTLDIKPKSCSSSYQEPTVTSGFPGLLGQRIELGGNDIFGSLSGNVLCLQCQTPTTDYENLTRSEQEAAIQMTNNGSVAGQIFLGPIDLPPVPTPPSNLGFGPATPITKSTSISAGDNTGACRVEDRGALPPITHCVVDSIQLNGDKTLTVNTTNGDVRIYVTGNTVDFAGGNNGGYIKHEPAGASPSSLGLFGRPADLNDGNDQVVRIAGASANNSMWVYFPDGNVGINGGRNTAVSCDSAGECTGGNIYGAVWAKEWNGSSSNVAKLVVPADMGTQLFNTFGPQYALGIRDYVALGVSHWSSWTKQ